MKVKKIVADISPIYLEKCDGSVVESVNGSVFMKLGRIRKEKNKDSNDRKI